MIGRKIKKNTEEMATYPEVADWCNQNDAVIVDKGDFFEVVIPPEDPRKNLLRERNVIRRWIDSHRDLSLDILIGVTTIEASEDIISEMRSKKQRLKEIDDILKQEGDAK